MSDVSRETPPPPPAAAQVFGDRLPLAERYADLLAGPGVERGLLGPREVERLWERHLLNCAVLTDLVPADARVADLGSGAGLPGLVLALRRPDLVVTLVEPLLRRATFLSECVSDLDLRGVEVLRERAEALHGRRRFDVVTSRALAPLPRLLEWSLPLCAPGGVVLAIKGERARDEVAGIRPLLAGLGADEPDVVHVGSAELLSPTTVVRTRSQALPALDSHRRSGRRPRPGGRRN